MKQFTLRLNPFNGSFRYNIELPVFWQIQEKTQIGKCIISHDDQGMIGAFTLNRNVKAEDFIRYYFVWPDTDERTLIAILITDTADDARTIRDSLINQ